MERLSDFLGVTNEFLLERFKFISKKQSCIKIQEDLSIVLTNLPNIYLFRGFYKNEGNNNKLVTEKNNDRLATKKNNDKLVAEVKAKYYI